MRATPNAAYRLWTRPELLAEWMAHRESGGDDKPHLVAVENVAMGSEPGEPFRIDMVTREPDGSTRTWVHEGEVLDLSPPSSFAIMWISEGTDHRETRLELTFSEADGDATDITLVHDGFTTREMADEHAEGWEVLLEVFNEAVVSAAGAGLKIGAAELKRRLAAFRARRDATES